MAIYMWREFTPPELCFTAEEANSTVALNKIGNPTEVELEISTNGFDWSSYTIGDTITLDNVGDRVYFRNTSTTDTGFSIGQANNLYKFVMTGSIAGGGDITYLLNKNGTTTLTGQRCFSTLFINCSSLTSSPKFPATTLTQGCYFATFYNCTSLIEAPELPATTLTSNCYNSMFEKCSSLTTIHALPATNVSSASGCYNYMFRYCTSLETLLKLPSTSITSYCYEQMFANCSKIKLSTTKTGIYQTAYRIPTTGSGLTSGNNPLTNMFDGTGGTFTGTPTINTTYYTSNTVI